MSIKVLHLIDSGGLYGAEMMLLNLVEEQVKSGLKPLILSIGTYEDEKKPLEQAAEKKLLPIKTYRMKAGFNIISGFGILKFAQNQKFQILHSHGYKFNILLGLIPRHMRKIPTITTVHGYVHAAYFSKMRLYQYLDRLSLKWLDFVVFVSVITEQKVNVELQYTTVINNGINMKERAENLEVDNKIINEALLNSSFTIGAFGRLTSEKGFDVLICAFKKVIHVVPDSKLIIWGDGYLRKALEELIRKENLSDSVILPGYTEYVAYYLKQINMMVMSSHTEGFPIILLEAMKYKVPVLATEVGSISEILGCGDCGFLVRQNDVKSLADKAIYFHRHRAESENMVDRAYKRVNKIYSSHLMAKKYFNLYSSIV